MTHTLSKAQIEQLKVELAQYGLDVRPVAKPKHNDWIAEQERKVRAVTMKAQSGFWKTGQLRLLKLRREISPEYEAFISSGRRRLLQA